VEMQQGESTASRRASRRELSQPTNPRKRRIMKLIGVCGLLCAAVPGFWHFSFPQEHPAPYQFTKIADTRGGVFREFQLSTAIDENGMVLFRAHLVSGGQGIFKANGTVTTQIANTSGPFDGFRGAPAVSNNGQVVFYASRPGGDFGYSNGADATGDFLYSNKDFVDLGDLVINNEGTVAFKAKKSKGRNERRQIFLGNGGRPIPIPDSKNNQIGMLSLNNLGHVAFSTGSKVYVSDGKTTTLLTDGDKQYFLFYRPVINDHGMVVVQTASEPQDDWVAKHLVAIVDGKVTVLASTQGPFRDLLSSHAVNNHGQVVFSALLDGGITGIFAGPNPIADVVIKKGDPLLGMKIVEGPVFSNRGFNDAGQIVFYARLEDGTEGIYRADPNFPHTGGILTNSPTTSKSSSLTH
jgi:hypothetical protein